MPTFLLLSNIALWLVSAFLGFLLLGTLRSLGVLKWQLEQLEATTPSRVGRNGLKPGSKAPDFTLPAVAGGDVSLSDFLGRRTLIVFVQSGCGPCHDIVPELNRFAGHNADLHVLAVNHASREEARAWTTETGARFPVLVQDDLSVSKRFEAFATPFAFLIDEQGIVRSKGIAASHEHLQYVLAQADRRPSRLTGDSFAQVVQR
jgi:methylamine dehydrogenase accessory protein MauD